MYGVLIVDDNPLIRKGLPSLIPWESHGAAVVGAAKDGEEALGLCRELGPDIVITDIRMPGRDGLYLLDVLQREFPGVSTIVISAYDEFSYAKKALEAGSTSYILKPISPRELEKALDKAIERCESRLATSRESNARAVLDVADSLESGKANYLLLVRGSAPEAALASAPGISSARSVGLAEGSESCVLLSFDVESDPGPEGLCGVACPGGEPCVASRLPFGLAARGVQEALLDSSELLRLQAFRFPGAAAPAAEGELPLEERLRLYLAAGKAAALVDLLGEGLEPCGRTDRETLRKNKAAVVAFIKALMAASNEHFDLARDLLERIESQERTGAFGSSADLAAGISGLLDRICEDEAMGADGTRKLAAQIKRAIDENYMRDLGLESLASVFCYSTAYLGRAFKRGYGMSLAKYINEVRMREAAKLLAYTDKKVAQISEDVGIADHIYFSKQFKRWSGLTPGAYRSDKRK